MGSHYPNESSFGQMPDELPTGSSGDLTKSQVAAFSAPVEEVGFQDGEVIRIELYEEVPTIHRETFVREKIQIRKIATQEATGS
jgi:hypothetical protein